MFAMTEEPMYTHTETSVTPRLVRLWPSDRANVTDKDIARLERFGFIVIFVKDRAEIVCDPNETGDDPEVQP